MTTPVKHGYPDWGRYKAEADVLYLNQLGVTITAQSDRGSFFVGNTTHIAVDMFAITSHGTLTFNWFADEAETIILTSSDVEIRETHAFTGALPVQGPYVRIRITPATASFTFDLRCWAARGPILSGQNAQDSVLLSLQGQAVPVGTTIFTVPNRVYLGPVSWHVTSTLGNWYAFLQGIDAAGVVYFLDSINVNTGPDTHITYAPAMVLRVRFDNNTGAGGSADIFLNTNPLQLIA